MRMVAMDIGNSKTRIGIFQEGELQYTAQVPTDPEQSSAALFSSYQDVLQDSIQDLPIFAACVVPEVRETLSDRVTWIDHTSPCNFTIKRAQKETLGADIIAGTQAVVSMYHVPAIVVDAGTATTVTYIDEEKAFWGGVICPGLGISANALFAKAHALDPVDFVIPETSIAHTTTQAIQGGLMFGHAGMISSLVGRIQSEARCENASVICTGGAIHGLMPILPTSYIFDPELVLKGIAAIGMKHFSH